MKETGRALAVALLVAGAVYFMVEGTKTHERCTTVYASDTATTISGGAAGSAPLMPMKKTCAQAGLIDPPVVVPALVLLLLAVPVLRVTELDIGGVKIRRAVKDASDAAKSASSAADRAASAALAVANIAVANIATAKAAARSEASGNVLVFGGGPARDVPSAEVAAAFALAAYGVAQTVARLPGISQAVVLWLDGATDSLRPHSDLNSAGVDMRSPLGDFVRRVIPGVVLVQTPEEVHQLGLDVAAPATALAIPAAREDSPAVGLILAVLDGTEPAQEVEAGTAKFGLPTAVLIERLTVARPASRMSWEESG